MPTTRSILADRISIVHGIPRRGAMGSRRMVTLVLQALIAALSDGERVELRGLGSFRPSIRPPHNHPGGPVGPVVVLLRVGFIFRPSPAIRASALEALS